MKNKAFDKKNCLCELNLQMEHEYFTWNLIVTRYSDEEEKRKFHFDLKPEDPDFEVDIPFGTRDMAVSSP